MRVDFVKTIIILAISIALGFLCYAIADASESRNWICLTVSAASLFLCLTSAFAIDYKRGARNVNIKVTASTMSFIVLIVNFVFAFFAFRPVVYIAIIALLALLNLALVYGLAKK